MSRLLASWVPVEERGRLGSLVFAGRYATHYTPLGFGVSLV